MVLGLLFILEDSMKVLVTGGAGFIGSHIVDALVNMGQQVIVVDNLSHGKKEHINPQTTFYNVDISSRYLIEIFNKEKPDYVLHQAAQISVQSSIQEPLLDAKN